LESALRSPQWLEDCHGAKKTRAVDMHALEK